jgi:mycothiol synthase
MNARPTRGRAARPAKKLPAGLALRPWDGDADMRAMVEVAHAANDADGIDERTSVEELHNFFRRTSDHFDPARDLTVVEVDGQVMGYGWNSWIDTTDGLREYRVSGYIHPRWLRRGIGSRLLEHLEDRAREMAAEHPTEATSFYGTWSPEGRAGKRALLEGAGYRPVRVFYEMLCAPIDQVDLPPMPAGLEVRPIPTDRASLRRLFDADAEAFKDHWGGFTADDAAFEEWLADPKFDPSLHVVAWEGDEIAGGVINTISEHENAAFHRARGWLDSVFVRRPWRRRGLAQALVARSLVALRERGMSEAMLGVDADNPTGAVGVYERAGFTVAQRSFAYRRPIQPDR